VSPAKPLQASLPARLRKQAERLSHRFTPGPRLVPDYLIIGVKRGGTTSLAEYLFQHPDVLPPYVPKGPRYFDVNYGRGWKWYTTHFPTEATGRRHLEHTGVQPVTGDSSPYIIFHPLALERVRLRLPNAKLVLSLRDPVVRAWSQYNYEVKRGFEDLDIHAALDAEPERLRGEEDRLREDPSYVSKTHRHNAYFARGHYAAQLRHLRDLFPPEQVHVLVAEDMFAEPQVAYDALTDFIGLPRAPLTDPRAFKANTYEPLPDDVRARLAAYYAEPNEELFELLGRRAPWTSV
jgi:hypothetical protein